MADTKKPAKRTAVDIIADEIGPTLRWATATIERTPGRGSGDGGSAPRSANRGSSAPADEGYFGDEEPF